MNEGWFDEQYVALLSEAEARTATERYRVAEALPNHSLVGLLGWDDFILRAPNGQTYSAPTVPLALEHLSPFEVPPAASLEPDPRFTGRLKWYVKPIAFGGDPNAKDNLVWVSHEQHAELVVWWNAKYREIKASGAGA
jgi:hypothetical protein